MGFQETVTKMVQPPCRPAMRRSVSPQWPRASARRGNGRLLPQRTEVLGPRIRRPSLLLADSSCLRSRNTWQRPHPVRGRRSHPKRTYPFKNLVPASHRRSRSATVVPPRIPEEEWLKSPSLNPLCSNPAMSAAFALADRLAICMHQASPLPATAKAEPEGGRPDGLHGASLLRALWDTHRRMQSAISGLKYQARRCCFAFSQPRPKLAPRAQCRQQVRGIAPARCMSIASCIPYCWAFRAFQSIRCHRHRAAACPPTTPDRLGWNGNTSIHPRRNQSEPERWVKRPQLNFPAQAALHLASHAPK